MDDLNKLQADYLRIFESIKPVLDDMRSHWDWYPEYLGWFDLGSPIFQNPDILFVGINPGPGRFRLWNYKKPKNLQTIPTDYPTPWRSELHWTKDGVSREGKWFDDTSKLKNLFPKTMCELLVRIYRPDFPLPEYPRDKMTSVFNNRIMSTNLFPMVTENINNLNKLLKKYDSKNHTDITLLCKSSVMSLIDLVSPKLVVLLGNTLMPYLKSDIEKQGISCVCIDRTRGWHSKKRIEKKALEIHGLLFSPNMELK